MSKRFKHFSYAELILLIEALDIFCASVKNMKLVHNICTHLRQEIKEEMEGKRE